LEVIDWSTLAILRIDSKLILEQSMKSDVFEPTLASHQSEIALPIGSEAFSGTPRADD
jgi:hypothetical protein